MGRPRLTLLCGVILAATAFVTPAFAIDPADPLASESTTLAPVPVVTRSGPSWAAPQIATVVAAGLMGPDVTSFRPDDALTRGELHERDRRPGQAAPGADRPEPRRHDARARRAARRRRRAAPVREADPARRTGRRARADGHARDGDRRPPPRAPRQPPVGQEDLERSPKQPASRAEAAYSLAKLSLLDPTRIDAVRQVVATFSVPTLTEWQRLVLTRALRFVGYPYVFAGTSEKPQTIWSTSAPGNQLAVPGGFDCSGLVWRVFKLQPYDGAPSLADVLKGRTTYAMSGEVKRAQRIAPGLVQPADVLFFGTQGTQSKPSEIGHSGIYVGNSWFVHSSSGGVTLQPLQGWYADELAWARRPLAEAGLTA